MKKIGIFYGSSMGTTETVAEKIAELLNIEKADIHNVAKAKVAQTEPYDVLLLGTSTWGHGELQDDWDSFIGKLDKADLSAKTVALFGCGDSYANDTTFCDGMGILYQELQKTKCHFCGKTETSGYNFEQSKAVVDGAFVGLPIDENNEAELTDERIEKWVDNLKNNCLK